MTTIITVHGTEDGDPSDTGEKWWQLDSPFQRKIQALIDEEIEFVPFHWTGENSEYTRRLAALELQKKVSSLSRENEESNKTKEIGVISHSHGGNVCLHATGTLAESFCISVGTPFFYHQKKVKSSLMAIAEAVGVFLLPILIILILLTSALDYGDVPYLGSMLSIFVISIMWIRFTQFRDKYMQSHSIERIEEHWKRAGVVHSIENRWVNLWDKRDEVLGAFALAPSIKTNIIPTKFMSGVIGVILAIFLTMLTLITVNVFNWSGLILDNFRSEASSYTEFIDIAAEELIRADNIRKVEVPSGPVMMELIALIFMTFFVWLAISQFIADKISKRVSEALDGYLSRLTKKHAYGNDVEGLPNPYVFIAPGSFNKKWSPLPDELSDRLEEHTSERASSLLRSARSILGLAHSGVDLDTIVEKAKQTFTWRELIHTSYFDVDEFVKLAAYCLIQKSSLNPSQKFKDDPDFNRVADWYNEMKPSSA